MKKLNSRWVLGHLVTSFQTSGNYDLAIGETPPNVPGPPPHLHNKFEESFLVIEGEMDFTINGEAKLVKAGELIDIPARTIHTFSNNGIGTCKWVNIHSPKGFQDFFETLGVLSQEEDAQKKSVAPELIDKVIQSASDFDMQIQI